MPRHRTAALARAGLVGDVRVSEEVNVASVEGARKESSGGLRPAPGPTRYDAFISYSHEDRAAALGIQRGLHRIGRRLGQLSALRVFRDSTDLTASPSLWGQVEAAMNSSRYFVLVLSPDAVRSRWVERELAHWLAHRGPESLFLVVAGGRLVWDEDARRFDPELSTVALPELCRPGLFADEPLWVDISDDEPWSIESPAFRDRVADLAAPIHGRSKYELAGEDAREQRKFILLRRAVICGLALLTVCALVAALVAVGQTREALRQRNEAVALALAAASQTAANTNSALAMALGAESVLATPTPLWQSDSALVHARIAAAQGAAQSVREPLRGHTNFVQSLAISPDGKVAASGGSDDAIRLWSLPDGAPIGGPLAGHGNGVFALAFNDSGRLLASGSTDQTVRLWDPATGAPVGVLEQPSLVHALAFAPGGDVLAVATGATLQLWSVSRRVPLGAPLIDQDYAIVSVAYSDDGALLAAGTFDSRVIVWDTRTLRVVHDIPAGYQTGVGEVAFRPGSHLLAASGDRAVTLWDADRGTPIAGPSSGAGRSLGFSSDGRLLASAGDANTMVLWDAETLEPIGEPLAGHTDVVSAIAFGGDPELVVSGSFDNTLRLWKPQDRDPLGRTLRGHEGSVTSVASDAAGDLLASGGFDNTIRLWDPATGAAVGRPLTGHTDTVMALSFDPTSPRLASAGYDGTIRLWDPAAGAETGEPLRGHTGAVNDVAFGPSGRLLASAGDDLTVRLWDPATRQPVGVPLAGHDNHVFCVVFSPDGTLLASGDGDGVVKIWDVAADPPRERTTLRVPASVRGLAFSPDGGRLATADFGNGVRLWDVAGGAQVGDPLDGHTDDVYAVAFSRDGRTLISAGADDAVRLWSATTGEAIGDPLPGHTAGVYDVAVSGTGAVVSAGADGTVRVWDALWDPARACELAAPFVARRQLETYLLPGWTPRCPYPS